MAKKEQTKTPVAKGKGSTKASSKKSSKTASKKGADKNAVAAPKQLRLIRQDEWLQPFAAAIEGRHQHVIDKLAELTNGGKQKLSDFATGYLYLASISRTRNGSFASGHPTLPPSMSSAISTTGR